MTTSKSLKFDRLPEVDDLPGVIEDIFSIKLDILGGWGYDNNSAVEIKTLNIPIEQFFHTFASMRANIEMNLTLDENKRYGGINLTQIEHKEFEIENKKFNLVTFKITAMKEKSYKKFIQEYKDNYGKKEFDLKRHFEERQKNTLELQSDFWFIFKD